MVAARFEPKVRQPPAFSVKQWLLAIALVVAAHCVSLGRNWQLEPSAETPQYLPIDLRPMELSQEPAAVTPQSKPKPSLASSKVGATTAHTPSPMENPSMSAESTLQTELDTLTAPEAQTAQTLTPPQPAVSAAELTSGQEHGEKKQSLPPALIDSATADYLQDGAEKIALTVPLAIKVPASTNRTFVARNKAKIFSPDIPIEFLWKYENDHYEVSLGGGAFVAAFNKWALQSKGSVGSSGLSPDSFTATRRDGTKSVSYFDKTHNRVVFGTPGHPSKPLLPGAQNDISAAMQLAAMFYGEPQRYQIGDRIVMPVVRRTDAQVWVFNVDAFETVELPAGLTQTVKLTRSPRSKFDTTVSVWLAPEHQYLPVRLLFVNGPDQSVDVLWKGF